MQVGRHTPHASLFTKAAASLLHHAAFEALRQQQRLGYSCRAQPVAHAGIIGILVSVSGSAAPDHAMAAIERFLEAYVSETVPSLSSTTLHDAISAVDAVRPFGIVALLCLHVTELCAAAGCKHWMSAGLLICSSSCVDLDHCVSSIGSNRSASSAACCCASS